jgi:hemolysin III
MTTARPLLRGVFHILGFFLAIPALGLLQATARSEQAARYVAIYAVTLLGLLGVSGIYHRVTWSPAGRARMRLVDHSAIFLLIAGTYTPICMLGIGGMLGATLCAMIWIGALCGIAQTLFCPNAPRALHVGIYVVLGWAGIFGLYSEGRNIGSVGVFFHLFGGVLYTLGAVAYARKRPDPWPRVFGYHEIYHVLVLIACGCLFEVVRRCVAASG